MKHKISRAKENLLKKIYYNVEDPGSYGSIKSLYNSAVEKNKRINRKDVKMFLIKQKLYARTKPRRKKFTRRKTIARHINHIWTIDVAYMVKYAKHNTGVRYLLVIVDMFSRMSYVKTMLYKNAVKAVKAFKKILKETRGKTPLKLHADKGSEFFNKRFLQLLKKYNIYIYTSENEMKASIVERYIRSLKNKIFKYMMANKTKRYINVLPSIVTSLNKRYHRSLGRSPQSITPKNQKDVFEYQYGKYLRSKNKIANYSIGDDVLIYAIKNVFTKGYVPNFTDEVFTIIDVLPTNPKTYRLVDKNNEVIKGPFYEKELSRYEADNHI